MKGMLCENYQKLLQWFCRKELRRIADKDIRTREELIRYHDLMAIQCINEETKTEARVLGIAVSTAKMLEDPSIQ